MASVEEILGLRPAQSTEDILGPRPGELVTGPAADHWWTETISGKTLSAFGVGASQAWGAPAEAERGTEEYLRKIGIWEDYNKTKEDYAKAGNEAWYRRAVQQFTEGLTRVPMRAIAGALQPVSALLGGSVGAIEAYGEAHEQAAQDYLGKQPGTFLGAVEKTLGTPLAYAEGMAAEGIKALPDYVPASGAGLLEAAGVMRGIQKTNSILDILHSDAEKEFQFFKNPRENIPEPSLSNVPDQTPVQGYNPTNTLAPREIEATQAKTPIDAVRGPLAYTGQARSLQEFQAARSRGLIGAGEEGFFNTTPLSEEEIATRMQAANDAGVPTPKPKMPVFDADKIAREVDPDLYTEYDGLIGERNTLRQKIEEKSAQARRNPQAVEVEKEIDSILSKANYVESNLTKKQRKRVEQLEKVLEAYHVSDDPNIAAANRSLLDDPEGIPVVKDSPEVAALRKQLLKNDKKLRDISPRLRKARDHAENLIPEAIDPPAPKQSEQSVLVETPTAAPVKPAEEATVSFTTSKGSTYQAHSDGSTSRNKSYHPEHGPQDVGPKLKSEKTIYLTAEQIEKIAELQTLGGPARILAPLGDGRWGLKYTEGENKGKFIARTVIEPTDAPSKGLSPVEMWDGGRRVHFGNQIVDVGQPVTKTMETAVQAETKPLSETPPPVHVTPGAQAFIANDNLVGGTGELRVRGLSRQIVDSNIGEEMIRQFGDLDEWADYYEVTARKEQIQTALDYVFENYEKAKNILMEGGEPPKGVLRSSLYMAFRRHATSVGDFESLREIANNSFAGKEQTAMGKYLSMLAERDPNDPFVAMESVKKNRERAAEAQGINQKAEAKKIEDEFLKLVGRNATKKDLHDFIMGIICK